MQVLENRAFPRGDQQMGAELTSFKSKNAGTEYVWQATLWRGSGTRLSCSDRRAAQGQDLYRRRQGIRDHPAWLRPRSGMAGEPRERHLRVVHAHAERLHEKDVSVGLPVHGALYAGRLLAQKGHITENCSDSTMYYEVGGHDAYNLCWQDGEQVTDYYVAFEGTDKLCRIVTDEAVMLTEERTDVPLDNGRLPITRELFANDAVMAEGLPVRRASIGCTKNSRRVTMDFADFDYFAVWSPYKDFDVPFVCLEPWSTLPDGSYLDHAIEHKTGVRVLQPGQSETLSFTTTVSE